MKAGADTVLVERCIIRSFRIIVAVSPPRNCVCACTGILYVFLEVNVTKSVTAPSCPVSSRYEMWGELFTFKLLGPAKGRATNEVCNVKLWGVISGTVNS
jgi:hypothetical protein